MKAKIRVSVLSTVLRLLCSPRVHLDVMMTMSIEINLIPSIDETINSLSENSKEFSSLLLFKIQVNLNEI